MGREVDCGGRVEWLLGMRMGHAEDGFRRDGLTKAPPKALKRPQPPSPPTLPPLRFPP